jgi:hypothetical protein
MHTLFEGLIRCTAGRNRCSQDAAEPNSQYFQYASASSWLSFEFYQHIATVYGDGKAVVHTFGGMFDVSWAPEPKNSWK